MVFSSFVFIFWFLPVFLLCYYIVPKRWKNAILFLGSIVFYAWGEPKYILLLLLSILVNYAAGILMVHIRSKSKRFGKVIFVMTLLFDFGMLLFFKYINFFIDNLNRLGGTDFSAIDVSLPLGISFYTFQIVSYIIDLHLGKVTVERSILRLGTYLAMFPQLIAGPIVIYSDVSKALEKRSISLGQIEEGVQEFIFGLGSKVLLANNIGMLWEELGTIGYENISMPLAWLGVVSFTLQIYFDFNGYSLMAIGLGKMLGFEFPMNFNYPYISKSITEFWRRWHMTLSGWFREYVYIPLGGNRKGKVRTYVNLLIVWALTGFWHGASWNFVLWGLFFFVVLSIEKLWMTPFLEKHSCFARIYSLLIIGLSWMIFAITDFSSLLLYFKRLFSFQMGADAVYYLKNYALIFLIGIVFSTPALRIYYKEQKRSVVKTAILAAVFVLSAAYLADASYNPFLYFRF